MHRENAPAHNSKRSPEDFEATRGIEVPHPASSADIAPSDFDIIDNLKMKLQSVAMTDQDKPLSAITEIFSATPQDEFIAVYQNWMKRFY
jgi:hypothetical protein